MEPGGEAEGHDDDHQQGGHQAALEEVAGGIVARAVGVEVDGLGVQQGDGGAGPEHGDHGQGQGVLGAHDLGDADHDGYENGRPRSPR